MPKPITTEPTPWTQIILVCRKCSKKLEGGFGPEGDQTLPRALKTELRQTHHRRAVRVIETKCLGVCPKNAVTVLPASAPGALLTVPVGTPVGDLLAHMALPWTPPNP